jgi:type IV secretion system protein VirD4
VQFDRIAETETRLKSTAERLCEAVAIRIAEGPGMSARSRLSIAEVLKQTVPDPVEIGFA